jgi:tripartite-type tricarboxylate transporter receptor subunit TctC
MKTVKLVPAAAFALALIASLATAQEAWPSRPVKLIVPSSPGGGTDLYAQALVPVFDTPEQFATNLKKERDGWAAFIQRNGIAQEE